MNHFFTFYGNDSLDDNGHGTHAAGLAGGVIHGLAKEATLHAVKILGADGLGSITSLLAGMNQVCMLAPIDQSFFYLNEKCPSCMLCWAVCVF